MHVWETSRDIFISKQFVCEVNALKIALVSWFSLFFWKILTQIASMFHYFCVCGSVIFAREVARDLLVIHRVNIISQISSLSWMKHDSAPKIVAWRHKCWVTSRRIPATGSAQYIASNKYAWTKQDCSPLRRRVTRS